MFCSLSGSEAAFGKGYVLGSLLKKAVVIVALMILAIEGYYVYRFYAALPAASDAPPAATDTTVFETTAPRTEPASRPSEQERESEAEYVATIGEIQAGSVKAFLDSDEKLLRPDSLTAADVEDMADNRLALRKYDAQVEDLEPPEKYADQYELFAAAVDDLHGAAEIAYRLAADPASATQSDYDKYALLVDAAATGLQRSNEILGEDYATVERAQGDGR